MFAASPPTDRIQAGGGIVQVSSAGAATITPTSAQNASIVLAGGGAFSISGGNQSFAKEANYTVSVLASTTANTAGGNLTISSAAAAGSTATAAGGTLTLNSGAGAALAATASTAGAGGLLSVTGANGGATSGVVTGSTVGGAGAGLTFTAGTGGNAAGGTVTNTGGAGGTITLVAGNAGTGGNANGGNIVLTPGTATGSGTAGSVQVTTGGINVTAGGVTVTAGHIATGGAVNTAYELFLTEGYSAGSGAAKLYITNGLTATAAGINIYVVNLDAILATAGQANNQGYGLAVQPTFTKTSGSWALQYGLFVQPTYVAGTAGSTNYGAFIGVVSGGGTNNYGAYISTPTGTGAVGLYIAGAGLTVAAGTSTVAALVSSGASGIASSIGTTAANLTLSTTTSGTLAVTSAGLLTLTGVGASVWTPGAGATIVSDAVTGIKIGTATTQLLGFYNATPVAQIAGTIDVLAGLVTLGFRAASSNPPLNLGTGAITSGAITSSGVMSITGAAVGNGASVVSIAGTATQNTNGVSIFALALTTTISAGGFTSVYGQGYYLAPVFTLAAGTFAETYALNTAATYVAATTNYGIKVGVVNGGTSNNYGIYISTPTGTGAVGLLIQGAGATVTGLITANTGISLAANQKIGAVSGVIGHSVVSTAYTLGSAGTVVLPNANMSGAANDAARDVLAGNIDGAIALDTGVAGRIYIRDAGAWKFALAT